MSLVGSGFVCEPNAAAMEHMDMAGMDMASMDMSDMPMPTQAPTPHDEQAPGNSPNCSLPWAPGCQAMGPCAPNAVTATMVAFTAHEARPDQPSWRDGNLRSVTRSPEPPPPRV